MVNRTDAAREYDQEPRPLRPCRRCRHLFWKVYFHGLILVVVAGGAIALIEIKLGHPEGAPWHEFQLDVARHLSENSEYLLSRSADLEESLRRELEFHDTQVSVYTLDGRLIMTNIRPALSPLSAPDLARLDGRLFHPSGRGEKTTAAGLPREGHSVAYVLMHRSRSGVAPLSLRITIAVIAVLLVLCLGSLPIAHFITAPVERLTVAARLIGSGDLSVRTGISSGRRDEVGHLAVAFDEMAGRLERLVQSERELLANISHELRTPLSRIRVAAEIAEEGDPERAKAYLSEISVDLKELDRLIEDVLTLARLDVAEAKKSPGSFPVHLERIDVCEFAVKTAERFRMANPEVILNMDASPSIRPLDADPALLQRAISNLLDNARKYSEPGVPILLRCGESDGCVVIEVRDGGIGIDPEDLPRIFEPFFRTDRSRTRQAGGVGLGLALVRRIVNAHGGNISVDSASGSGTTFRIRLPAAD
ncbi:MAG: HAMP domain-containing histidine kinase [Acidobacteria bacterium]|nr:HAMP domain-containing histidine kinase [Acidobacteriota bacterium]